MPSFFSHYWIPELWWVYDATVGAMLNFFSPIRVIMCKHLFCKELGLTIFLCSCVVYCANDMDHESAINHHYYSLKSQLFHILNTEVT